MFYLLLTVHHGKRNGSFNLHLLNSRVSIGVGGAFDFLTNRSTIPPEWISRIGLEWLWRLVHEPWRWKRQLSLVRFALKLF